MLKIFPLFYVALMYSFSAKDKIVFFMNQFAMFCSVLTIGLIICIFSIMNGFEHSITGSIIDHYGHLYIIHDSKGPNALEQANSFNGGFDMLTINNKNIDRLEYKKMQQTLAIINSNEYKVFVMEDPTLTVPLAIPENFDKNIKIFNSIDIFDPNTYNPMTQTSRHKVYKQYTIIKQKVAEPVIFMSSKEYKKLFRNENYTFLKIYLKDESKIVDTLFDIGKTLPKGLEISSWREINPQFVSQLDLQKKIFYLFYFILFTLLAAIIVSINIAFFKEKRKDWALLKILDISPLSVERIFFYKNLISIFITTIFGSILGYYLTIYSNDIVNYLINTSGARYDADFFFGEQSIPYIFKQQDFFKINMFSSIVFFVNFFILLLVFRKENVSKLFKIGGN